METPDFSAFAQYIPGFDFLQNLARQAAGGTQSGAIPPLGHWVAPTFSVEELDKRIRDLRAVQFWLDQNAHALAATIQALEVQKMTLATLKGMNVSLQDVADSFKIKPEQVTPTPFFWGSEPPRPAPEAAQSQPAPEPPQSAEPQREADKPAVDAMQWWGALTEQFSAIATSTLQEMAGQAAKAAEQVAQTVQAGTEAAGKMAEQAAAQAAQATQAGEGAAAEADRPAAKRARSAAKTARAPRAAKPRESGSES